ncbi:MAG: flagellar basal body rod protein FlgB [Clostridiales bacterium]|jgi:flagellar basal-body rod protein FlgB|nr:flagellar basal body rod protein FlgB [Clostridiales bacterium]
MFEGLFVQNNIIETAMQASVLKNDVILNNIANADTPNYKRKDVEFESILRDTLESAGKPGGADLSKLKPRVYVADQNYSYRLDGNNVDIETEMVGFYQNSTKYDTMTSSVINNYKRINLALTIK